MKDSKKKSSIFSRKIYPLALIVGLVLVFFWKVVLHGYVPFPGDFVVGVYYPWLDYKWGYVVGVPVKNPILADVPSFIYPMQTFAVDLMKKGEWPLWNPHILGGVPLLANFQSAPFSPTSWVYFLFDKITAWSIQIIIQHVLAAFFTYLLLRHWKVSRFAGIVGGIIFAFSGFNLIWSQWNGHALAAAFIPLILLFEDRWLKKGKFLDGVGLAVALALQIFSGYPQVVFYTVIAMGILWIVRARDKDKVVSKTLFLVIFSILGLGLSAVQILPGVELLSLSQWLAEPYPFDWTFLPWQKVITFIAPDFFGNHATYNYWGPQDYTSNTAYVGVVAIVLSTFSIRYVRKRKAVLFSLLLLLATLILSFPTPVSVFLWENNLFGTGSSSANRALVLANLSIALLAGFGVDTLLSRQFKFKYRYFAFPFLVLAGFGIYALTQRGIVVRGIPISVVALRNLVLPIGVFVAVTITLFLISKFKSFKIPGLLFLSLLLILELFRFGWKFTPFSIRDFVFPSTPVLDFLSSQERPFRITGSRVIPVNLAMPYTLESLEGYETMRPFYSSKFIASLNKGTSLANPAGRYGIIDNDTSHLLDLVNTKYYLTHKIDEKGTPSPQGLIPERFDSKRFNLAYEDKSVAIMESKSALPRAFMVYDWEVVEDDKRILDKLLDPDFPFETKIILDEEPGIKKVSRVSRVPRANYLNYGSQESLIELETEKEGMLFVSDAFYPGWKVFVDGVQTKIYRANYAFRAVPIPGGKHQIHFTYQPNSFSTGLKISAISLVVLLILYPTQKLLGKKK